MLRQLLLKFYGEVLPYLKTPKNEEEEEKLQVEVPNITGITIKEAEKKVKELGLEISIEEGINKENKVINEQIPKEGIKVDEGSKIIIKY